MEEEKKRFRHPNSLANLRPFKKGTNGCHLGYTKKAAARRERLELLTKIARREVEMPVSAGQIVSAISEINKMEHVYEEKPQYTDNRAFNIIVSSEEAKQLTERVAERLLLNVPGNGNQAPDD